jgi:hypothetical protein
MLPLAGFFQPLDCDVNVPHGTEAAIQPLQFTFQSNPFGVEGHRREKSYGSPQTGQRNAHFVQARVVAPACTRVICGQIVKAAARDDAKGRVACHRPVQLRR